MNTTIRITKVHLSSDNEVTIYWQEFNETIRDWGKYSVEESEAPLDSLGESLQALTATVRTYREEGVLRLEDYTVTTLSFFYGKTDTAGAEAHYKVMIGAHRKLRQGGPANCNTSRLQVTAESEDAVCVTDDEALKIDKVATEAIRYINGERKQMPLPEEDDSEGELPLDDIVVEDADFEVVEGGEE